MKRNSSKKLKFFSLNFFAVILAFFSLPTFAQKAMTVLTAQQDGNRIFVVINYPNENTANDVEVRLYEVIQAGDRTKTILRDTSHPVLIKEKESASFTIQTPAPSPDFIRFEIDVSNYRLKGDKLNFRESALPVVTAQILKAGNDKVKVSFLVPSAVAGSCAGARNWIMAAFDPDANTGFKITLTNNKTATYRVMSAETAQPVPPLATPNLLANCTITSTLTLDRDLPAREALDPVVITFDEKFIASDRTLARNPAFARLRGGISGAVTTEALDEAEKRDDQRKVVLEIGGGLTTQKKKENVTDPKADRETKGFLDLRLASPSISFGKKKDARGLRRYWTWTPAEFEAMVSEGKISNDNLTSNTMRLFTQLKHTIRTSRSGPSDFTHFILEGGATADRDLRVIDYTGGADLNFVPGFLNRTFGNESATNTPVINFSITPAGFEIGGRQARRDTFFPNSDTFIRRFRFSGKLDFQFPPFVQLSIENRSWVRGEVDERRFRNHFKTTFTLYPRTLSDRFSAGVFLSYERGTLPPFVTPSLSTFKIGFRIRKKDW